MSTAMVKRLHQVKELRAGRAEQDLRRARALLAQAESGVAEARRALDDWVEEMPRRSDGIYAAAIGQQLNVDQLEALNRSIVALAEHRRVLEHRVEEAGKAVKAARDGVTAAERALAEAERAVGKFTELVEVLRRADLLEQERREDAELEEAAERAARAAEEAPDEWDRAA